MQENFGIFDGDTSSLMRSSEGRRRLPEAFRACLGVRESPANAMLSEMLREGGSVVDRSCRVRGVSRDEKTSGSLADPSLLPQPVVCDPEC